ncbi:MAG: DUF2786 domain-containing protein [Myxococcales bacterium]|nr:DUF2786 domain-containing protein [Myxococcales bacterium]
MAATGEATWAWSAELEASLLRELHANYAWENRARFGGKLVAPVLALGDAHHRLGQWVSATRTLELSRALMLQRPWLEVLSVLQHEMAHQFVDEVLKIRDETAHGATFARVCAERGIDAKAVGSPVPAPPAGFDGASGSAPPNEQGRAQANANRMLGRIRKLLALAGSSEVHEAEAAMRKAHELMLRYNIEAVEVRSRAGYVVTHLGDSSKRRNRVEAAVMGLLAELFFVKVIQLPIYLPALGKHGHVYEIAGTEPNVAMASHVYAFLMATAARLWDANRADARVRSGRDRLAYQAGVVRGFHEKLAAERKALAAAPTASPSTSPPQAGNALVWRGDPGLDAFYRARNPRITSRRARVRHNTAHAAGAEAGRRVVLHQPVTAGGAGGGERLLGSGR